MLRRSAVPLVVGLATVLALGGVGFVAPGAADEGRRVEVVPDQTATVVGRFDSLADLVTELCRAADVELRAFEAPDRPVVVDQVEQPLRSVLERLLMRENYVLGVTRGAGGSATTVAWIRVTGARGARNGMPSGGLSVPSTFGERPFERESPRDREHAARAVAERLLADETRVAALLEMDARTLARSLRQYPHIGPVLRRLRAEHDDPRVRAKLDELIGLLGAEQ